jgi:hypothetical protein
MFSSVDPLLDEKKIHQDKDAVAAFRVFFIVISGFLCFLGQNRSIGPLQKLLLDF